MIGLFPPRPLSYFPSRKQDFHPEVFLSVGLPLEIMATFLYLTRVIFFSLFIPDAGIDLLLNVTIPCFFFYPDTPHRIIPIPSPPYRLLIIFFSKKVIAGIIASAEGTSLLGGLGSS